MSSPSSAFQSALVTRRTVYGLSKKSSIPNEKIVEIVQHAILHTPSSFNSQSNRAIVLFGASHTKLWSIISDALKAIVPADQFEATAAKIQSFEAGYGTVLYFVDTTDVKTLESQFPAYAANFAPWAEQSIGIVQGNVWTAFALEGLGASLQHYSALIGEQVRTAFSVPESWSLIAQQPFGVPAEGWVNPSKEFKPIADRVKVFN